MNKYFDFAVNRKMGKPTRFPQNGLAKMYPMKMVKSEFYGLFKVGFTLYRKPVLVSLQLFPSFHGTNVQRDDRLHKDNFWAL